MQPENICVLLGNRGTRVLFQSLCPDNGVESHLKVEGFPCGLGHGKQARFFDIGQCLDKWGHQVPDLFPFFFLPHGSDQ